MLKRLLLIVLIASALAWLFRPWLQMFLAFHSPIRFYGKVVDQNGDAVTNAAVKLYANNNIGGSSSQYNKATDSNGCFSITGVGGLTLAAAVSKPGYREYPPSYGKVTSSGLFEYGLSSNGPYLSSPNSPTVFVLYKIGAIEPLLKTGEKSFALFKDGTPVPISLDGKQGTHKIVLRCWINDKEPGEWHIEFDWRCEISVAAGGLRPRPDDFVFEAPLNEYTPTDVIDMPASLKLPTWRSVVPKDYFIRFDDGTFARVKIEIVAKGDHFVTFESYFNPKPGSRNLESDK